MIDKGHFMPKILEKISTLQNNAIILIDMTLVDNTEACYIVVVVGHKKLNGVYKTTG